MKYQKSITKDSEEKLLFNAVKEDSHFAFSCLFNRYYKDLVLFGGIYISDQGICEDIVQNVFLNLWKNRKELYIQTSLKSYLLRSTQNRCLDELRHRQLVDEHANYEIRCGIMEYNDTDSYVLYSDLYKHLQEALEQLSPVDRRIFELSRLNKVKYQDISREMNISVRTVEVRISKALKQLRVLMREYNLQLILFLLSL